MNLEHAEYTLKYLEPAEVAFLILYSYDNYGAVPSHPKRPTGVIDVEQADGSNYVSQGPRKGTFGSIDEPDEIDGNHFSGYVEMWIEAKDQPNFSVWLDGAYSGSISSGWKSNDPYQPDDPDESTLTDVDVNALHVSKEEGDYMEIEKSIDQNTESTVSYNDLMNLTVNCILSILDVSTDVEVKDHKIAFPPKLMTKIENLKKEHEREIRPKILGKKYKI
jgi:hypothetical protein